MLTEATEVNFAIVNPQLFWTPGKVKRGGFFIEFSTPQDLAFFIKNYCAKIFPKSDYQVSLGSGQPTEKRFFAVSVIEGDEQTQIDRIKDILFWMSATFVRGNFAQKLAEKNGVSKFFD